ncbi:copper homeostasis protein CutC [Fulvivirga sedimenti]|uniref:Copper homeostasis protein cutC homolog n=1 Tax=Fulvivirga sedimenti TaxID=2879465 RepID=A0A9X1KW07_9BACT|nr:copper homeostasis protein CutC [Fulvivirga sedimenti]MCA6073474.1 copper homeostasis protein CutC [Fulvivirga sedimenti]
MLKPYVIEACVESANQAVEAEKNGADRLELCSDLANDGLTPSFDLVREVLSLVSIPVFVMIRPRPGNFTFTKQEMQLMHKSIFLFQSLGVHGFVTGILDYRMMPDINAINTLVRSAAPLPVTFHKAIDQTPDILQAASLLRQHTGISAILTSGGQPTAWEGREMIRQLVRRMGKKIQIIAAGKVTSSNLSEIHRVIQAPAYHGRRIVS